MGNCIGGSVHPPGASRALRCMAVPGGKSFYVWQDSYKEQRRLLDKLRVAAQAMANMPVKRCLNMWRGTCEEANEAKRKLKMAVIGIVHAKARKAFAQWAEICAAANAKKEKLRAALAGFTPEGREKKAAFRKIAWIRKRKLAMLRATAGFRLSGCRHFLHALAEMSEQLRKLRKGGAAIVLRKVRACYSSWAEVALKGAENNRKLAAALKRMSPEGRALAYGFGAFVELLQTLQNLRRAASGFLNGSLKRAMTAWIESTFAAFHISIGMTGHKQFKMRKAMRLWVGRAGVRRGLRKQVFISALKGKDVMKLLQMADMADTDDLANAILAKDAEGCTPLLQASKKGHLDASEMFITSGARCAEELRDESLLRQLLDSTDHDGNTALHWAARKGHGEVASALLEAGANINAQNLEEATPLHWAARKNQGPLLRMLIDAKADLEAQNKWGQTALAMAHAYTCGYAVAILEQAEIKQAAGAAAAAGGGGGRPKKKKPKPGAPAYSTFGEGVVGTGAPPKPPKLREQQDRRRQEAEKRRQEALKMRDQLDETKAKDQELRRRQKACEMQLRDLLDQIDGALQREARKQSNGWDGRSKSPPLRAKSPPKASVMHALEAALKEGREVGVLPATLQLADESLKKAEAIREAARQAKAAGEAGEAGEDAAAADGGRGRSPRRKKKPGEKDPDAEMAKMQRKMAKKMGR